MSELDNTLDNIDMRLKDVESDLNSLEQLSNILNGKNKDADEVLNNQADIVREDAEDFSDLVNNIANEYNLEYLEGKQKIEFSPLLGDKRKVILRAVKNPLEIYNKTAIRLKSDLNEWKNSNTVQTLQNLSERDISSNAVYERAVEEADEIISRRIDQINSGIFVPGLRENQEYEDASEFVLDEVVYPVLNDLLSYREKFIEYIDSAEDEYKSETIEQAYELVEK